MAAPVEVLITLPFPEDLLNEIRGVSNQIRVTSLRANRADDIPADVWGRTEVLYTHRILPTAEQAPNLRWIQFHSAGIDHAANASILKKPDLTATTISGAASSKLGEFVVMMLLALGHRLPALFENQKKAEWPKDRWERFNPTELRNSTVGIVGYGSIGRQVARLLNEFGVKILATKRDAMHPEDTGYAPEDQGDVSGELVHRLYPHQALHSMLKECDFVVITVPLTPETRGMFGAKEIAAMKPGAYLVDVSRGGILDHNALAAALKEKKIGGAALDVFPEEPLPKDSPLWKFPNVIITPHISGISPHYDERAIQLFAENLQRYLAGVPLYNRFDLERGY